MYFGGAFLILILDEHIFYIVHFILSKEKCNFVQNTYFSC
jgi:hypothetical protein